MLLKRLKNLWELSRFHPTDDTSPTLVDENGTMYSSTNMMLRETVPKPTQQRLATIVGDDPLDIFPEEKEI